MMGATRDRSFQFRSIAGGFLLILAGVCVGGCGWQQPKPVNEAQYDPSQADLVKVAPRQLMQIIRQKLPAPPLSIPIASMGDGALLTGWKEYPGRVHIVRRWQERTRFKITILPDFNNPTGASHVRVVDETQEKPSAQQPWYPAPDDRRPERAAQVLNFIRQAALGPTDNSATAPSQVKWTR